MKEKKPRYFERPDDGEESLSLWQTIIVVLSSHIGVRPKASRENDFRRANGLHVFIVALMYFFVVLVLLVILVNSIS
jgi:hypothetical protein|tara:strand:- start:1302 stop:1532 length:231 start_codon:yes stop_codon:yes gene_type:complete